MKAAAAEWLSKPPQQNTVRYTFANEGTLGIRLSQDLPPWVLDVRDGSLAAKKAPRVPLGGIVQAVNGYDLSQKVCQMAIKGLGKPQVVIDIQWPFDQGKPMT